jgi:hypothetical protein
VVTICTTFFSIKIVLPLCVSYDHQKVKIRLCVCYEDVQGSGGMAPRQLNLFSRWRWVSLRANIGYFRNHHQPVDLCSGVCLLSGSTRPLQYFYTYLNPAQLSRYSDWLRAGWARGRSASPSRVKNFLFSASSRPVLGSFPEGKAAGAWSWPHLQLVPKSRMYGSIHPLPQRLHSIVLN